jgi:hypothetical protein
VKGKQVNFLVLVHSIATGDVVRQWVTDAENAEQAVQKYGSRLLADAEHAVAIPTGSEPSAAAEPATAAAEPAAAAAEPAAESATAAAPDTAALVVQELSTLPKEVLDKVVALLKGAV